MSSTEDANIAQSIGDLLDIDYIEPSRRLELARIALPHISEDKFRKDMSDMVDRFESDMSKMKSFTFGSSEWATAVIVKVKSIGKYEMSLNISDFHAMFHCLMIVAYDSSDPFTARAAGLLSSISESLGIDSV